MRHEPVESEEDDDFAWDGIGVLFGFWTYKNEISFYAATIAVLESG